MDESSNRSPSTEPTTPAAPAQPPAATGGASGTGSGDVPGFGGGFGAGATGGDIGYGGSDGWDHEGVDAGPSWEGVDAAPWVGDEDFAADAAQLPPGDPSLFGAARGTCAGVATLGADGWKPRVASSPEEASAAMMGSWFGTAISPWGGWELDATFSEGGYYLARARDPRQLAFYYGTDSDTPLKRWWLDGLRPGTSVALGGIDIIFWYEGNTPAESFYQESGYQGSLDCVQVSEDGQRLRFEFWYDSYGPFVYDLRRPLDGGAYL
jgi:hypothetical protein